MNLDFLSNYNGLAGLPVLITLIIILTGITICAKKGIISFNGKGLRIGYSEKERSIIRKQLQYLNTAADASLQFLPPRLKEGLHYYRAKYIVSKYKDLLEETIIYNHIEDTEDYIELKQEIAYNLIMKLTDDEFFKKDEFKKYIYDLTETIIRRFVKIRRMEER